MITVAKTAGFCFGVNRAVEYLENTDKPTATLGPIIHNTSVVDKLKDKGVVAIDSIDELPEGSVLAIRTHGVGKTIYDAIEREGYKYMRCVAKFIGKTDF